MCDAALRAAPAARRVGLYTSPHLVSFAERIRIDGRPVEADLLMDAAERLRPAIEQSGASFFEATTAMAFLCFQRSGVDVAVVEVGLGGRLDATNVVTPLVTVVTNVARDHTEFLGESIREIAYEKAGIFKPGIPAISAETDPDALMVLKQSAAEVGAPFRSLADGVKVHGVHTASGQTLARFRSPYWSERSLQIPLAGTHQARNAVLAAEALSLLPDDLRPQWADIERGFGSVRWPGRFQVERVGSTTWVFDVAHNPAGVQVLAEALDALDLPRPWILVVGILSDKDWRDMLPPLLDRVDAAVLTIPPTAPEHRRWDPEQAASRLRMEHSIPLRVIPDLALALQRASTLAPHGTVLVTGSFHTVGDSMKELGISPV